MRAASNAEVEFTDEMKENWKAAWAAYFGEGFETKEDWLGKMVAFAEGGEESVQIAIPINALLFKCVDLNGDGVCSLKEYRSFIQPLGVYDFDEVTKCFDIIDTNGDGVIDDKEFASACVHYYVDNMVSPFQNFYGLWAEDSVETSK